MNEIDRKEPLTTVREIAYIYDKKRVIGLIRESNDIIFYQSPQGSIRIEVVFEDETFWLSEKRMAELFGVEVHTINYHLKEIFKVASFRKIQLFEKFEQLPRMAKTI